MYFYLKTAKKQTINHYDFSGPLDAPKPLKSIKQGEVFLQISNGTIGRGARAKNIGNKQAIEMLEKMLKELKANQIEEFTANDSGFSIDNVPF